MLPQPIGSSLRYGRGVPPLFTTTGSVHYHTRASDSAPHRQKSLTVGDFFGAA